MGLESVIEKLDKYFSRLQKGKAKKIKPTHVDKVMKKLEAKAADLEADLAEAESDAKQQRLQQKLDIVREQQERARWLKEQIAGSDPE